MNNPSNINTGEKISPIRKRAISKIGKNFTDFVVRSPPNRCRDLHNYMKLQLMRFTIDFFSAVEYLVCCYLSFN